MCHRHVRFARPPKGGNQHRLTDQPWQIDARIMLLHMRYVDRDWSAEVGRRRMETVAAHDAVGDTHRIGTWADRNARLEDAIARIKASDCPALTPTDRIRFAERQSQLYEERGRRPLWKGGVSSGFRLPDDWAGLV